MKSRKFYPGILNHCYQRSADGGVLFYTYSDHLVYFTEYCMAAREYDIQVLSLCQMPDHVHDAVRTARKESLSQFKRKVNTGFSRKRNAFFGTDGPVLKSHFGSAPKYGDKHARTNLIYIGNNPVERRLVKKAEEYRWNYLAYAQSDNPFSEKLVVRKATWPLQRAIREVKTLFKSGRPIGYATLQRLFSALDRKETLQLVDFIVSTYNCIDYAAAFRFFGSAEEMLSAMHATTGNEYDLNEVFVGKTDAPYARMTSLLLKHGFVQDIHDILRLGMDAQFELFRWLLPRTDAPAEQIAHFLHMPLKQSTDLPNDRRMEVIDNQNET